MLVSPASWIGRSSSAPLTVLLFAGASTPDVVVSAVKEVEAVMADKLRLPAFPQLNSLTILTSSQGKIFQFPRSPSLLSQPLSVHRQASPFEGAIAAWPSLIISADSVPCRRGDGEFPPPQNWTSNPAGSLFSPLTWKESTSRYSSGILK